MRIKRIEIEGEGGTLTIERIEDSRLFRIDSTLRDPRGRNAWDTWWLGTHASRDDLFKVAAAVQERTDGHAGTNSMIHDYLRELERFMG